MTTLVNAQEKRDSILNDTLGTISITPGSNLDYKWHEGFAITWVGRGTQPATMADLRADVTNNFFKYFISLLSVCFMFFLLGCTEIHAQNFDEINFYPIELNAKNINKFPFLQKYKNENDEYRQEWEANYQTDLTLPDEFPEIKINAAEDIVIDNDKYDFFLITGGRGHYCYNGGCSINIYKKNEFIGSFSTGGMMPKILTCSGKDYIVSGGGSGINAKAPVRAIINNSMKIAYQAESIDAQKICYALAGAKGHI